MLRKILCVSGMLLCMFALSACGKKVDKEKEAQESAAEVENKEPEVVPGEMVFIPAGEFIMGSNDTGTTKDIYLAYPEHKVKLPAYWIDKYEVTFLQFQDFSIKNKYIGEGAKAGKDWRLFMTPETALYPIVGISWNDANAYCKSQGKRLPTEAEWEKAGRGTDGRRYPWGNEWEDGRANTHEAGNAKAVQIGQFNDVSPFGVHDMLGNVQEWTDSWFPAYPGNPQPHPKMGTKIRSVRGLASGFIGKKGHIWERAAWPGNHIYNFGCRCAKDATPEDIAKAAQAKK